MFNNPLIANKLKLTYAKTIAESLSFSDWGKAFHTFDIL